MKIALDAMGGDYAPLETTKGALEAIKESNITVVLVGKEEELQKILKDYEYDKSRIEIVNAEEVIRDA